MSGWCTRHKLYQSTKRLDQNKANIRMSQIQRLSLSKDAHDTMHIQIKLKNNCISTPLVTFACSIVPRRYWVNAKRSFHTTCAHAF